MSVSIHKFVCSSLHVVVCMYQFAYTSLHKSVCMYIQVYINQFACTYNFTQISLHAQVYTIQFVFKSYICANTMYLGLIVHTCYDGSALYVHRHKNIYNITCT